MDESEFQSYVRRLDFISRREVLKLAGYGSIAAFLASCGIGGGQQNKTTTGVCTGVGLRNCPPSSKDTLIIGSSLPVHLDEEFSNGLETSEAFINLHDPHIQYNVIQDPAGYQRANWGHGIDSYGPWLAESFNVSSDGLTWTYKLRQGVKSHAGNELTTADIKYLFERHQALKAGGAFANIVSGANINNITLVDKYTWSYTTAKPNPIAVDGIGLRNYYDPIDSTEYKKHATSDDPWSTKWAARNEAGFGPYKLVTFEPGNQFVMERFDGYWGPKPSIKRVIYKDVPEAANRLSLLEAKQIDIAKFLSPTEFVAAAHSAGLKVPSARGTLQVFGHINVGKGGPLGDKRVRQALNLLTPETEIITSVYQGTQGARPWRDAVRDFDQGYDSSKWPWDYDPAKAKTLLAEAGYGSGFTVHLLCDAVFPETQQIAVILKNRWAQAGIQAQIDTVPETAYNAQYESSNFDIVINRSEAFLPDTEYFFILWYQTGAFVNFGHYSNPVVDDAVTRASQTLDPQVRLKAFQDALVQLRQDVPFVNIALVNTEYGMVQSLQGYTYYPTNHLLFSNLWFS